MARLNLSDLDDGDIERDDVRRQAEEAEKAARLDSESDSDSDLDLDAQLHKIRFDKPPSTTTASSSQNAIDVVVETDLQKRPGPGKWMEGVKARPSRPMKRPKGVIPPRNLTEEEKKTMGEEFEVRVFRREMQIMANEGRLKTSSMSMTVVQDKGNVKSLNEGIDDFIPEEDSESDQEMEK